jgi:hypothetical protein
LCAGLICSPATGHQRSEERYNRSLYLHDRSRKLKEQLSATNSTAVLGGVSIWIDGYLEDTTDIEMKEVVKAAGGEIKYVHLHLKFHRTFYAFGTLHLTRDCVL